VRFFQRFKAATVTFIDVSLAGRARRCVKPINKVHTTSENRNAFHFNQQSAGIEKKTTTTCKRNWMRALSSFLSTAFQSRSFQGEIVLNAKKGKLCSSDSHEMTNFRMQNNTKRRRWEIPLRLIENLKLFLAWKWEFMNNIKPEDCDMI